jgi:sugar phosphate isomerase/epimerase
MMRPLRNSTSNAHRFDAAPSTASETASRRNFLQLAAGASAAGLLLPRWLRAADSLKGEDMAFGLVTYQWGRDWDLPTLIANCQKTGTLGVELRTQHAHGVEVDLDKAQRAEVRRRFEDSPVTLVGLGTNDDFDDPDPQKLKQSLELARQHVVLSHDVGGTGVKVKPNDLHPNVPREKTIEQIGRSLNTLAEFAAGYGQEIRLEVHGKCSELPTIRAIMEYAPHENVGVCWNCNAQDLQGAGLEANFRMVRKRFARTVHVRELDGDAYPYQQLIDLLVDSDYEGWILLEARTAPEDRVAALEAQRQLFQRMVKQAQQKS